MAVMLTFEVISGKFNAYGINKRYIEVPPKNTMAWSYRKSATHRNSKKDVRKAVCNKTKRKTKNEMAG